MRSPRPHVKGYGINVEKLYAAQNYSDEKQIQKSKDNYRKKNENNNNITAIYRNYNSIHETTLAKLGKEPVSLMNKLTF